MGECDCINGCEKCATPFNPENVIRYQPWLDTGITDTVVAASDYDKLLALYRAQPEGNGWIAVTPETMPEAGKEYWIWGRRLGQTRRDFLIYGGNGPQWQSFGNALVTHYQLIVPPSPPVGEKP